MVPEKFYLKWGQKCLPQYKGPSEIKNGYIEKEKVSIRIPELKLQVSNV